MEKILVKRGDITQEKVEGIVNPANSFGVMGGGVAGIIKRKGGQKIEQEVIGKAPIPLGSAVSTSAGALLAKFVIHAPTMKRPAQRSSPENVEKATLAALECASRNNLSSLAFPGMGTGVGGISKKDAVKVMVETIKEFFRKEKTSLKKIILIGYDKELYEEFRKAVEK